MQGANSNVKENVVFGLESPILAGKMSSREKKAVEIASALCESYRKKRDRLIARDDFQLSHTDAQIRTDTYLGELGNSEDVARMARWCDYFFQTASFDLTDKVIVDVGCGFGIHGRFFAGWGARKVFGIDPVPVHRLVNEEILTPAIPRLNFQYVEATSSKTSLPDGSADCLTVFEAASHFRDLKHFWKEAARILKPGGVLILSDSNNGCNAKIRKELLQEWQGYEKGYLNMRRDFVLSRYPSLSSNTVEKLAAESSGMDFQELQQACENFLKTNQTPGNRYRIGSVPLNPKEGMPMEIKLDPYECASNLRQEGFTVRVLSCYTAGRGGLWQVANKFLRFLSPLTIRWAPSFNIIAHKQV